MQGHHATAGYREMEKKQQQSVIYLKRDRAIFSQMLEHFQRRRYLGNEEIG